MDLKDKKRGATSISKLFVENYLYWTSVGLTSVAYSSFFVTELFSGKNIPAATKLYGICETFYFLSQLIGNPFFGEFSDYFGRKNTFLIILGASSMNWFILSTARTSTIIIISRILHGFCDSNPQTISSYLSDLTKQDDFAKKMGILHGVGGIGMVSGLIIAFFLSWFGFTNQHMFMVSSSVSFLNGLFVYLFLPESKEMTNSKTKFNWARANPVGSIKFIFKNKKFKSLIVILILDIIGGTCSVVLLQFYLQMKYHFSDTKIYVLLFEASIFQIFSMAVLLKLSIKKRGNKQTLVDAFLAQALFNFLSIVLTDGWMFFLIVPLVYQFVAFSVIQSFFRTLVPKDDQGILFGSLQLTANFANAISKYIYPVGFSYTSKRYHFPEAPFIFATLSSILGFIITSKIDEKDYFKRVRKKETLISF
ncbi:tetracycline-efflux transporter [Anaeramoeba flamelloides]|uniref:Tetracycline-efflux transporter n=1 Tax=Anaeramoeba flamelloides TaxID=1746091 RepID=A0AAV8A241_9EUKA|nr:tetracycline-efflux transporter [Anaeramoeba flamelloides]